MNKMQQTKACIKTGIGYTRKRPGLVALVYLVNVLVAGLLAVPVFTAVYHAIGPTGFGSDLISEAGITLWVEMWPEVMPAFQSLLASMIVVLPLYMLWKTVMHMGLIYALHQGALWPFTGNLGHYAWKGLQIALLFLPLRIIWCVLVLFVVLALAGAWPGEVGTVTVYAWIAPTLLISGLAVLDLMQRYARIANVVRHDAPIQAMASGMRWPVQYGEASLVYVGWFFFGLFVMALPMLFGISLETVWTGFIIQQVFLLVRAGVSVAWVGSEVVLFERTWESELPLIAKGGYPE